MNNYNFTDAEDIVLAECLSFLYDVGIPDHMDQKSFDTLWEKVFVTNTPYKRL